MSKYLDKVKQAFVNLKGKERDTYMHRIISMALYEQAFDSIEFLIDTEYQNFITACILRRHLGSEAEVIDYLPYIRAHPKAGEAAIKCAQYGDVEGIRFLYEQGVSFKPFKSNILSSFRGSVSDRNEVKEIISKPKLNKAAKGHL